MHIIDQIQQELTAVADAARAPFAARYFQAHEGGYGEGDRFIGVPVPQVRKVARQFYKEIQLQEIAKLLQHPVHEYRLAALFMLDLQFKKAKTEAAQKAIVDVYLSNLSGVNNWDLVDSSAPNILGAYLYNKPKTILYDFARSGNLWQQRIAIIATQYFIRRQQYDVTFEIAEILLHHKHDLIHKAVGWMLREVGNKDLASELQFLQTHYKTMPRTALRYAIEKFDPELRQQFIKGQV